MPGDLCLIFTVIFYGQPYDGMQIHEIWQKTRKPNLLRHKSGRYYARAFAGGKEVWKSLKTSHYGVTEAKLAEFMREHRERVSGNGNGDSNRCLSSTHPLSFRSRAQRNAFDTAAIGWHCSINRWIQTALCASKNALSFSSTRTIKRFPSPVTTKRQTCRRLPLSVLARNNCFVNAVCPLPKEPDP